MSHFSLVVLLVCIMTITCAPTDQGHYDLTSNTTERLSKVFRDPSPRQISPSSQIKRMVRGCESCVINFQVKDYPEMFFFHLHIPKTGGRTFLECLKCWDKSSLVHHSTTRTRKRKWLCTDIDMNKLNIGIRRNKRHIVSCEISGGGGVIKSFVNSIQVPDVKILTIIRNPMDHLFSALMHFKLLGNRKNPCKNFQELISNKDCEHYDLKNMQTTALSVSDAANITEAVSMITRHVFHFGITKYYRASLCLLAYQIGQLSYHREVCDCSVPSDLVVKHSNDISRVNGVAYSSDSDVLSQATQKLLEREYINLDNVLFHVALHLFLQRVLLAEQDSNMKLLCAATDGVEVIAFKNAIVEPKWHDM